MNIKTLTLAAVAALAGLASCSDQPDAYETTGGKPTVYYIRTAKAASRDSVLTGAYMQTPLCIVGENLRSIKQIDFNDRTAVLNTSYMTDNTILVSVPKTMPDMVTDKMYMITTSNDTVAYDFRVLINPPSVMALENEQAKPGEETAVLGNYFYDYPDNHVTVEFSNGYVLPWENVVSVTPGEIRFIVPEQAAPGYIKVGTKYGKTRSNFQFNDRRGMLFDFDTPNAVTNVVLGNHGWHNQKILNDEWSISGNYLQLGGVAMGANGAWNDSSFSFEYWPGNWGQGFVADGIKLTDIVDFTDYENMSVKFEMCIPEDAAWGAAPMQVIFGGVDKVTNDGDDSNTLAHPNNTFFQGGLARAIYAPWAGTGTTYDTGGKWKTVTLPIGGPNGVFNKAYDGSAASIALTSSDFTSLTIFCVNGGGYDGVDCKPIIKIDNIRVVPNK